jgi:CheY-like chemotaxis protein
MSAPFILYIEDDAHDVTLLRHALAAHSIPAQIVQVCTPQQFSESIACIEPDLIMADGNVPGFDTLAALELARKSCPFVPVYYLSGTVTPERAAMLTSRGAAGCLSKGDPAAVSAAIRKVLHDRPRGWEPTEAQS